MQNIPILLYTFLKKMQVFFLKYSVNSCYYIEKYGADALPEGYAPRSCISLAPPPDPQP